MPNTNNQIQLKTDLTLGWDKQLKKHLSTTDQQNVALSVTPAQPRYFDLPAS